MVAPSLVMIEPSLLWKDSIIMRPELYDAKHLVRLLKRKRIAMIDDLKGALGTQSDATVFRKLRHLPYLTSYSHSGKFYALEESAEFDELGLWSCGTVRFSRYGTLLATAVALVEEAEGGFFASELEALLEVTVKTALLQLTRKGRIHRQKIEGRQLYCSGEAAKRRKQVLARKTSAIEMSLAGAGFHPIATPDELQAAIVLFVSLLDEKQRRLYAGLESIKAGYGGDQRIARLLGIDVGTVSRGRHQLLEQEVEAERVRSLGGGRKTVKKKRRRSSGPSRN